MPTSAATSPFDEIARRAAAESPLWAAQLRSVPDGAPVFGPLAPMHALGVETIYEGYLVHYGRPRVFAPADAETALLLGDYLYAHGLVHVADTGDLDAVAALAELISTCAHLRGEGVGDDGDAWLDAVRRLGAVPDAAAVTEALAAHRERVG